MINFGKSLPLRRFGIIPDQGLLARNNCADMLIGPRSSVLTLAITIWMFGMSPVVHGADPAPRVAETIFPTAWARPWSAAESMDTQGRPLPTAYAQEYTVRGIIHM